MNVKSLGLHLLLPILLLASQPLRSQAPSAQAAINNPSADQYMVWDGARTGNLQYLQDYVVGRHTSPNFIYSFGGSPLWTAIEKNHPDAVQFLLDHGANIELGWVDGSAPLMQAARQQDPAILKLLLAHGAKVNAQNENGSTALGNALQNDLLGNAKSLFDAGATLSSETAAASLEGAITRNKLDTTRFLLDHGADPNAVVGNNKTPVLFAAVSEKNPEMVKLLLDHGATVDARDRDGNTPLLQAAGYLGDPALVKLLLDHHADPLAKNNDGRGIFGGAVLYGKSIAIVRLLVNHGVNPNEADRGNTPLFSAVASDGQDAPQIVAFLLDHGAAINAQSKDGSTPLMSLFIGLSFEDDSIRAHTAVLKLLLARGVNTTLTNSKGQTALDQMRWNCYLAPLLERAPYAHTVQCMTQLTATYKTVFKDPDADALRNYIMPIIFATLGALPSTPEVPENARRLYIQANTTLKAAQSPGDIKAAIAVYQQAILACPWYSSAFYNLSLAQEKASDFTAAKVSMDYAMKLEPQLATNRNMQDRQYTLEAQQNLADKNAEQQRYLEDRTKELRNRIGGLTMYKFWVSGNRDFTPCSAKKQANGECFAFSNENSPGQVGNGHDGTALGSTAVVTTEGDHIVLTLGTQRFCIPPNQVSYAASGIEQNIHFTESNQQHITDCGSPAKEIFNFSLLAEGNQYIHGGDGKSTPLSGTVQVTVEKCSDDACSKPDIAFYWYKP